MNLQCVESNPYLPWLVFHAGFITWSNWNVEMLAFVEEGELENPEKKPQSKIRTHNKPNSRMTPDQNHIGG